MAVKDLIYDGNELLLQNSEEIINIDDEIKNISKDMLDTMYKYDGIGLAAVQIGYLKRMIVYDCSYIEEGAKKKGVFRKNIAGRPVIGSAGMHVTFDLPISDA